MVKILTIDSTTYTMLIKDTGVVMRDAMIQSLKKFQDLLAQLRSPDSENERIVFDECTFDFPDFIDLRTINLSNCDFKNCTFKKTTRFAEDKLDTVSFEDSIFEEGIVVSPEKLGNRRSGLAKPNYICHLFVLHQSPPNPIRIQLTRERLVEGFVQCGGDVTCYPNYQSDKQLRTHIAWNIINFDRTDSVARRAVIYATAAFAVSDMYKNHNSVKLERDKLNQFQLLFNFNELEKKLGEAIKQQCDALSIKLLANKFSMPKEREIYQKIRSIQNQIVVIKPRISSESFVQLTLYYAKKLNPSATIFDQCCLVKNLSSEQYRELFELAFPYRPPTAAAGLFSGIASDSDCEAPPTVVTTPRPAAS